MVSLPAAGTSLLVQQSCIRLTLIHSCSAAALAATVTLLLDLSTYRSEHKTCCTHLVCTQGLSWEADSLDSDLPVHSCTQPSTVGDTESDVVLSRYTTIYATSQQHWHGLLIARWTPPEFSIAAARCQHTGRGAQGPAPAVLSARACRLLSNELHVSAGDSCCHTLRTHLLPHTRTCLSRFPSLSSSADAPLSHKDPIGALSAHLSYT